MNIRKQQGMGMLGVLITVIFVASALLLSMKVIPLYINDFAVGKAVNSLQDDQQLSSRTKREIRKIILKKLKTDYADGLAAENIEVVKNKGAIVIDVNYESRITVVANLDLIAKFSHHLEKTK